MFEDLISQAINERRQLEFYYNDKLRIVNPHQFGIYGELNQIHVYQVAGETNTQLGWKNFKVEKIQQLKLLSTKFDIENTYHPENSHYSEIYNSVFKDQITMPYKV